MKSTMIFRAIVAAGLAATTSQAGTIESIRRAGTFKVCANFDALPLSSDDSKTPGLHLEFAQMIAAQLGVALQISWVQLRYEAKFTGCDAFMDVAVLEGAEGHTKNTIAYMNFETLAVAKPGRRVETLEDLNGLRVATPSASLAHKALLDKPVDISVGYARENDILEAVRAGDVDIGLVSNISLAWYRKLHPEIVLESHSTKFIDEMNGYPVAIGLRQSNQETVDILNKVIQQLREQGTLQQLFAKYGMSDALR